MLLFIAVAGTFLQVNVIETNKDYTFLIVLRFHSGRGRPFQDIVTNNAICTFQVLFVVTSAAGVFFRMNTINDDENEYFPYVFS